MKNTRSIILLFLNFLLITIINSCTRDTITEEINDVNLNSKQELAQKNITNNEEYIYYLTENDFSLCSPNLQNASIYNKNFPNTFPIFTTSKWHSSASPTNPNIAYDYWFFSALIEKMNEYYFSGALGAPADIRVNVYSISEYNNDPTISKYGIILYPSDVTNFNPDTEVTSTKATEVMHALFTKINTLSSSTGKPLYAATLYINYTMCGGSAGMGAQLYFK